MIFITFCWARVVCKCWKKVKLIVKHVNRREWTKYEYRAGCTKVISSSWFYTFFIKCLHLRLSIIFGVLQVSLIHTFIHLVQRIGVKNRAYCSLLAGSAKTYVVLGSVIYCKLWIISPGAYFQREQTPENSFPLTFNTGI